METIRYYKNELKILDQSKLPREESYIDICDSRDLYYAIKELKVRGAPAIGVAAAVGVVVIMKNLFKAGKIRSCGEFLERLTSICDEIASSRPTAVNLGFTLSEIKKRADMFIAANEKKAGCDADFIEEVLIEIEKEAEKIRKEDIEACEAIGRCGLSVLRPKMRLLTHCNAGALATAGIGTALSPIYLGSARGYEFKVFVDETRPVLQGARLTTFELKKLNVEYDLICDSMAASLMAAGSIDAVLVGCDRMAANGDGANKIGTLSLAINAKYYDIPFYMFVPSSTIDFSIENGKDIPIEMRDGREITETYYSNSLPDDIRCEYNPSFDITPAELITAVITEKGVVRPNYKKNLKELFK